MRDISTINLKEKKTLDTVVAYDSRLIKKVFKNNVKSYAEIDGDHVLDLIRLVFDSSPKLDLVHYDIEPINLPLIIPMHKGEIDLSEKLVLRNAIGEECASEVVLDYVLNAETSEIRKQIDDFVSKANQNNLTHITAPSEFLKFFLPIPNIFGFNIDHYGTRSLIDKDKIPDEPFANYIKFRKSIDDTINLGVQSIESRDEKYNIYIFPIVDINPFNLKNLSLQIEIESKLEEDLQCLVRFTYLLDGKINQKKLAHSEIEITDGTFSYVQEENAKYFRETRTKKLFNPSEYDQQAKHLAGLVQSLNGSYIDLSVHDKINSVASDLKNKAPHQEQYNALREKIISIIDQNIDIIKTGSRLFHHFRDERLEYTIRFK